MNTMNTKQQNRSIIATLACVTLTSIPAHAALVRHWELDETSLPTDFGGAAGEVVDSTGNTSGGRFFGYTAGNVPAGILGQPAPSGLGTSYNFVEDSGTSGVFTNDPTALPELTDFSLSITVATTDTQAGQGALFSNNIGQAGRTNLIYLNGEIGFFLNGANFDTDGDFLGDGDFFSVAADGSNGVNVFDGEFHQVGVTREGSRFDIFIDGQVVTSGTTTTAGAIGQTESFMIGRNRGFGGDLDATIADVKVLDTFAIPEPSAALLALSSLGFCFLRRRRSH
jgi:hypothetical protein